MGVAVFRTHILVIGLSASRFYRFTDQPLRLQLGQIPVDGAEADLLGAQFLSDLPYLQQLIRMLIEKADQIIPLTGIVLLHPQTSRDLRIICKLR